ncbi:MAG TPA: F0F1 ATP synthase subunit delta [Steroidobacteraceae bacterium]|jgi:F-type H+-transporting ATPase subunit b|nr:F0F1 ATP synthase subunit delta [Steroidobacteraceae bacterium]
MLIDWYTVAAQALNFLILVWLLKRFLYQPVLDAIRTREQRIAMQLADAASKEAAATKEREEFARKNAEFDSQRSALLLHATAAANVERQRLLELARKDADALGSRLEESLRNDRQMLSGQIIRRTRDEVLAIARKTLADLSSASLEESMSRVFIDRLRALSAADSKLLAEAIGAASGAAIVRSAFELPAQRRTEIEQAIADISGAAVHVSYESVPGLISGVELSAGGRKLAWSIADYLTGLEKSVGEILQSSPLPAVGK